jgi:hypothetical protein
MSGPIDGPRRPPPISEIAGVTRTHEETDREQDERSETPFRSPQPEPPPDPKPDAEPASDATRGRNVDYRA